jgi:hypothetical protein
MQLLLKVYLNGSSGPLYPEDGEIKFFRKARNSWWIEGRNIPKHILSFPAYVTILIYYEKIRYL